MGSNVSVMVGELEMWDSIPQLEQGSKRACGFEVCSPTVFSGSGLIPFTSNYSGTPIFEYNTDFIGLILKTEKI